MLSLVKALGFLREFDGETSVREGIKNSLLIGQKTGISKQKGIT